jgi:hypothetical protein
MFLTGLALVAVGSFGYLALESVEKHNATAYKLKEELEKMGTGKVNSKAAKHILGDYVQAFKQNPELFSFGQPERLIIEETGEPVWSVQLNVWTRARDKHDELAYPHYSEAALFYHNPKGTLKPYIY